MISKSNYNSLDKVKEIALQQGNVVNLSQITSYVSCDSDELKEIIDYIQSFNISVSTEDVEPEPVSNTSIVSLSSNIDVPFNPEKIDIKMDKITIDSIIKRIINNELEFDSSFQRKTGLWNNIQKSQLIESILLKIPLPAFYFDASDDNKWQIIDGLQRISTIKEYAVDKSLKLDGLEFLTHLNGCTFGELPRPFQRRIEETNLNAYLVNPSTPINVKFNIFKRINTGGLVLEPQEIRNALYQGAAADFLRKISQNEFFKSATCHSIKSDRMLDREFCLRFVAFTFYNLETYNGNIDDYLNGAMGFLSTLNDDDFNQIEKSFSRVMLSAYKIFDKFAFRRMNTEERRGPINKALFEIWCRILYNLSDSEIDSLIAKKNKLYSLFTDKCNNYQFQNSLRASDRNSVNYRYSEILAIVNDLLVS